MRFLAAAAFALSVAVAGCSPYVRRGEALYREGRYIEAAEVFELTEAKLRASTSEVCAEYGLYRGLTYLRLDDLQNAHVWLTYANTVEQRLPGQLTAEERSLLAHAWKELSERSRARGVARQDSSRVAASEAVAGTARPPPSRAAE